MLAILLGIFKIFLYIILFILLFVVLCILTILFVPIRYNVQGEKYDTIKLDVKINWLLHIISFKYHMDDNTSMSLKIFGKDIMAEKKHKKVKKVNNKKSGKKQKKIDTQVQSETKIDNIQSQVDRDTNIDTDVLQETSKIEEDKINKVKAQDKVEQQSKQPNKTTVKKSSEKSNKRKDKKNKKSKDTKSKDKKSKGKKSKKDKGTSKWKQIYNNIKDFIKDEENRATLKKVKDKVLKIIKHILPKKFQSKLIIGTGDPASTGYVTGAMSILYTVTGNKLKVIPDFNEKIFQGCFYGKGKIYLIVLLKNTLSIILDKKVRKIYKTYKV